jgi:hypothetical protein
MNGADLKKGFDGGDSRTLRAQLRIRPEISELNMRGLLISILVFAIFLTPNDLLDTRQMH